MGGSALESLSKWTGGSIVYRARPILSLSGSWGGAEGKAREDLADVISMHEVLT